MTQRVLVKLAESNRPENDLSFSGTSALAHDAKHASIATGKVDSEFRLRLSEAVAVHHHNFDVLEKAVLHMCDAEKSAGIFARAAVMIEIFCSLSGEPKSTFEAGAPGLRF